MGMFDDIRDFFSPDTDFRQELESEWTSNDGPFSLIGAIIEDDERVRSPYRTLLSELREENRRRFNAHLDSVRDQREENRRQFRANLERMSGSVEAYIQEVMGDILEHEQNLAELGIHPLDEPFQKLEQVNWKKEGF